MSIFGTGFGQPNQQQQQQPQQQQQQQPNAFGQPSSFGGTGFGAFGQASQQQPQQQQPQANPMFGNLGGSTSNTGGFGAFGTPSNPTSTFGQPKPTFGATGTGAFGGTQPAFGSAGGGSTFGSTSTSGGFGGAGAGGGVFGQPAGQQQQQSQQGAFGGGGGLFGKTPGAGFGGTSALTTGSPLPTAGSSNPPYQEFQERDQGAGNVSTMLHYQSISCMPAYRKSSFEELRVQDYQQGRKTANSFGNAAPSAFGQPAQQQPTTGLFGQPAATGAFGQQQPSQSSGGFGAFGQQQQPPQQQQPQPGAFGAFGQPQQQQAPAAGGFGAFGQQQNPQQPAGGFGSFGQPQQQQQTGGFGAFGQQSQQNKGFGTFAQPQAGTTPFSAFGTTPTAGTSTGSTTGSSLFGQPQQQNQSPFGSFGQQNQQQNQQQQQGGGSLLKPSVFGQTSTGGGLFGNTAQQQPQQGGGLFGQSTGQQPQQQQQGGGLFGQQSSGVGAFGQPAQPAQQPSLFGQPASGGGLFGTNPQQNQPQQNQQAPGSGFGSLFSKPPGGGGLFGSTPPMQQNQQQNPNPSNPLFGGGGGGLFGNTNNQQQQQQPATTNPLFGGGSGGNLFGGKAPTPAPGFGGGGLFGSTNQQQQQQPGGLFGGATSQQQQPQQQSSLFGGSSFFGNSNQQQQQAQPSLTASIDQPLPTTAPTSLPPLPSLASSMSPKKKSNVFADIAARSSPRLGLGVSLNYTPPGPGTKLRGFGASVSMTTGVKNPFPLPPSGSQGKGGLPFSESKSLLSPDAFANGAGGSLQLLGGGRQSVKKLVLDKRVDEEELHRLRATHGASPAKGREVRFSPALGVAAREKDHALPRSVSPTPTPSPARPALRSTPRSNDASPLNKHTSSSPSSAPLDPQEGEYWCLPTVADLQRLSFGELQAVKDFTVGRVGFGTIQFLQPVDLTTVPSIADVPGKIVTFELVECMLYPDERLKPPAGEGLNIPARIKLDRCWATDKSTREPIKDENDPKHQQRLRKMKGQDGAEFVAFDMATGVWEFIVREF